MIPISAVIITFNEERNIARCLNSIKNLVDEMVVVDSFSSDKTCEIAKSLGAKVVLRKFEGYIEQKNYAITCASNDYILSLDADEWLDEPLQVKIMEIRQHELVDGYRFNRLNNYCGKWIRHGAWYPDRKLRLWNSKKGKWAGINPHDEFIMIKEARIETIPLNILHQSYTSVDSHKKKVNYFSEISAKAYAEKGKRSFYIKLIFSPVFRFIRDYFFKAGFLDGYYGLIIAWITASEVQMKYRRLIKIQWYSKT